MEKFNFKELTEFKALKSVVEQMVKKEGLEVELDNLVFKTKDYSHLKRMQGNRDVNKIDSLRKNIKTNGQKYTLGIVNEKLEISDGQHRKQVFEELGMPFYFTIKNMSIGDTRAINQSQRNWNMYDFIDSYAEEGNEQYINYKKFIESFPELKSTSKQIIQNSLAFARGNSDSFENVKKVEMGNFSCPDWSACYERASYIMMFKDIKGYNTRHFVGAILRILKQKNFIKDRLVKRVNERPNEIKAYRNSFEYEAKLISIYNSGQGLKQNMKLNKSKECDEHFNK